MNHVQIEGRHCAERIHTLVDSVFQSLISPWVHGLPVHSIPKPLFSSFDFG
jgi:hypothetical protein